MKNITFKQIKAFAAVARERSFTRAAQQLHLTQSTLTSSIKLLESEIGMPLFDRSTRTLVLTPQGELFLPTALRLLRDLHESLDDLESIVERQRGAVTVAATTSFIHYVLAPAVALMAADYPGITIRLSEDTTAQAAQKVIAAEADFGVATLFDAMPMLESEKLLTDTYGVVFDSDHALRDESEPVPWARLLGHTMIGLHHSNGIRALIDRHPDIPSPLKKPPYEVGAMPSMYPLLRQHFGYAALPALAATPLILFGMHFKPLTAPVLHRDLYIFKKKGRSMTPAARTLIEAIWESLVRMTPDTNIHVHGTSEALDKFCDA
jgi:LysR family carnitine catabolism transcriptional activator